MDTLFVRDIYFRDFANNPIPANQPLVSRGDGGTYFTSSMRSTFALPAVNEIDAPIASGGLYQYKPQGGYNVFSFSPGAGMQFYSNTSNGSLIIYNTGPEQIIADGNVLPFTSLPDYTVGGRTLQMVGTGDTYLGVSDATISINSVGLSSLSSIIYLQSTNFGLVGQFSTLNGQLYSSITSINILFNSTGMYTFNSISSYFLTPNVINISTVSTSLLYIDTNKIQDIPLRGSINDPCIIYTNNTAISTNTDFLTFNDNFTNVTFAIDKEYLYARSTLFFGLSTTTVTRGQQVQLGWFPGLSTQTNTNSLRSQFVPIIQQIQVLEQVVQSNAPYTCTISNYYLKNIGNFDEICDVNSLTLNTPLVYASSSKVYVSTLNNLSINTISPTGSIVGGPGFFVDPVRNDTAVTANFLHYNTATNEIVWNQTGGTPGGGCNLPGGSNYGNYLYYDGSAWIVGYSTIVIGDRAGNIGQGSNAVAIGGAAGYSAQGIGAVAVGYTAAKTSQGLGAIAVGIAAGATNQGVGAIAIGSNAGQGVASGQGANAVAIGNAAGTNQSALGVAIGFNAGYFQSQSAVAIGNQAGYITQNTNSVAIGNFAANINQDIESVAIGDNAGVRQSSYAVAIGYFAGNSNQDNGAIAIGSNAGLNNQGRFAIAIGAAAGTSNQSTATIVLNATGFPLNPTFASSLYASPVRNDTTLSTYVIHYNPTTKEISWNSESSIPVGGSNYGDYLYYNGTQWVVGYSTISLGDQAGAISQGASAVAVGAAAGYISQGALSVAIGNGAGQIRQSTSSVAIGNLAGQSTQANLCVAVGDSAGLTNQGTGLGYAVAVGQNAGFSNQGYAAIGVGPGAGKLNQQPFAISIGNGTGLSTQGTLAIAMGNYAGSLYQGSNAIAIGTFAGSNNQSTQAIAIGAYAGVSTQQVNAIAIGAYAGFSTQKVNAVAIGLNAGYTNQGSNAVAIGAYAGFTSQSSATIVLNATGVPLNTLYTSSLYAAPVRNDETLSTYVIHYNPTTKEISWNSQSSVPLGSNYGDYLYYNGNRWIVGYSTITLGDQAGAITQGSNAVAVGAAAGYSNQGVSAVAIGPQAGYSNQGVSAVAVGVAAGFSTQQSNAVAIGYNAGYVYQGSTSIAIGAYAGYNNQSTATIVLNATGVPLNTTYPSSFYAAPVRNDTTLSTYVIHYNPDTKEISWNSESSIPVGGSNYGDYLYYNGTQWIVGYSTISLGDQAGAITQGTSAVALGAAAGYINQGVSAVAVGAQAGYSNQGVSAVAVGAQAGYSNQGVSTIAIGVQAGFSTQQQLAVAVGSLAGYGNQGSNSVAIGTSAGYINQSTQAIAIGLNAGYINQGANSIAIGAYAGSSNQSTNTIVINATGLPLSTIYPSSFYIAPIRNDNTISNAVLQYNRSTNEVVWNYGNPILTVNFTVAVGGTTTISGLPNSIAYSYNGVNWFGVGASVFPNGPGLSVSWNGALWVVGGEDSSNTSATMGYSADGIHWTSVTSSPFTTNCYCSAYNGSLWLAGGNSSSADNTLAYSYNGINWTGLGLIFSASGYDVAWNGNLWVACGTDGTGRTLQYSYDGIYWYNCIQTVGATTLFPSTVYCIAWNGTMWVAGGFVTGSNNYSLAYSYDGINWVQATTQFFTTSCTCVAWNGYMWVAGGTSSGYNLCYSYDGKTWTSANNNIFSTHCNSITWNGTIWIAAGLDTTNTLAYSSDGINWFGLGKDLFGSSNGQGGWGIASRNTLPYIGSDTIPFSRASTISYGAGAGVYRQSAQAVAIGYNAGASTQGAYSIAIGAYAGQKYQSTATIVLNARGTPLNTLLPSSFYVAPIRFDPTISSILTYNSTTMEVAYTSKTFVIDHPKDLSKYLVHACLEGPEAGVYYRGTGTIADLESSAVITLPDYVDALAVDLTVQVTPIYNGSVRMLNASCVSDNKFTVYGDSGDFYWHVYGRRLAIAVEPEKSSVVVNGDGPYRWIA